MKTIVEENSEGLAIKPGRVRSTAAIWAVLGILIGALFIYAGIIKILDPVGFARDIDNYKMLPWPAAVAFGFYLPWLEVFCGIGLIIRRLYRGSLLILTGSTVLFIIASVIAKGRGLDISCGCFGHVSKGWSFGWHLALDFGILATLVILLWIEKKKVSARESHE
jgi:putative oxidoreductase